jgi:hypothetical protein
MSHYDEFLAEKEKIDALIKQGYVITEVKENLSGAFVDFVLDCEPAINEEKKIQLHILTADARKYFSNIIIKQQRKA